MYFDWVTWSIWAMGFVVFVLWTWLPIRELKQLLARRKTRLAAAPGQKDNDVDTRK